MTGGDIVYTFAIILALAGLIGFLVSLFLIFTAISDQVLQIAIILMIVFIFVGFFGLWLMASNRPATTETLQLVAMYSGQEVGTSGSFFVLGGRFISKEGSVYRYYYLGEDGGIRQGSAKVENSVIYSTDDDPYVEITGNGTRQEYKFYVPTNEWNFQLN